MTPHKHRALVGWAVAMGAAIGVTACNAVWGVDELSFGGAGAGASAAGTGGAAGSGTAGGQAGDAGSGGADGGSPPGCGGGIQNGTETAPDCGGGTCDPCGLGLACVLGSDCASGNCMVDRCVECGLSTGWRGPASAGSVDITGNATGSDIWLVLPNGSAPNVPAAIASEDAARGTATVAASHDSLALRTSSFGFVVPATAVMTGIQLRLRRATSGTSTNHDQVIQLVRGTNGVGANRADPVPVWAPTSAYEWKEYGGQGDLWDAGLSPVDVNASGFGVQVATHNAYGSADATAYIDVLSLQIFYCN